MPRPRKPGRHRKPEPVAAPDNAPALVLAVPGTPSAASRGIAEESLSVARSELPGLDARVGFLEGGSAEFPALREVLAQAASERSGRARAADGAAPDGPNALVVPLLAGPDAARQEAIHAEVRDSGSGAEVTDALGPHPLLAEGVHVRLSEAGLARADRARLFTVATAADGIILASVGGAEAAQAAGITGMLLAARLAVPVLAAALDEEGAVARTAEQLLGSGSRQLALAPCLIGPEAPEGLLESAASAANCPVAEPLGAYPAVGKLAVAAYAARLGIAVPQSSPQGAPSR